MNADGIRKFLEVSKQDVDANELLRMYGMRIRRPGHAGHEVLMVDGLVFFVTDYLFYTQFLENKNDFREAFAEKVQESAKADGIVIDPATFDQVWKNTMDVAPSNNLNFKFERFKALLTYAEFLMRLTVVEKAEKSKDRYVKENRHFTEKKLLVSLIEFDADCSDSSGRMLQKANAKDWILTDSTVERATKLLCPPVTNTVLSYASAYQMPSDTIE